MTPMKISCVLSLIAISAACSNPPPEGPPITSPPPDPGDPTTVRSME